MADWLPPTMADTLDPESEDLARKHHCGCGRTLPPNKLIDVTALPADKIAADFICDGCAEAARISGVYTKKEWMVALGCPSEITNLILQQ